MEISKKIASGAHTIETKIEELDLNIRRIRRLIEERLPDDSVANHNIHVATAKAGVRIPSIKCHSPETYAQQGEDLIVQSILESLRGDADFSEFTYLDIGANHPISMNNTYLMYRRGCSGILVEPNPDLSVDLFQARPRDQVIVAGIKFGEAVRAELYITSPDEFTTFSKEFIADWNKRHQEQVVIEKKIDVPLVDINELIDQNFKKRPPDFITIDAEGNDFFILRTIDFERFRPSVLVVEWSNLFRSDNRAKMINHLNHNSYQLVADTLVNGIFIAQ